MGETGKASQLTRIYCLKQVTIPSRYSISNRILLISYANPDLKGIQDAGTQATIKHYIANEQEHFRGDGGNSDTISSDIDDRTLHEVYLPPFAAAVKAGVASVMCSYNTVSLLNRRAVVAGMLMCLPRSILHTLVRTASYSMVS